MVLSSPKRAMGAFWLILWQKRLFLIKISIKFYVFQLYQTFFVHQNIKEAHIKASREKLTLQNCQKGCPKASKMVTFGKKASFPDEKSYKIETTAPKTLNYGLK